MENCPKCNRRLPPAAAQCPFSDCHAYFDTSALIWLQRDTIKRGSEEWERQKRLEEEEKAAKKAARAAKKAAASDPEAEKNLTELADKSESEETVAELNDEEAA